MSSAVLFWLFASTTLGQPGDAPVDDIGGAIAERLAASLTPETPVLQLLERTDAFTTENGQRTRRFDILVICRDWDFAVLSKRADSYRVTIRRFAGKRQPAVERGFWTKEAVVRLFAKVDDQCDSVSIGIGTVWDVGVGLTANGRVAWTSATSAR